MEKKQWELLQQLDQDITFNIKNCISDVIGFSGIARNHGKTAVKNVMLAGSAYEGTVLSRAFLDQEGRLERINAELELDLEFIVVELPKPLKERLEETEMNGFVCLRLTLDEAYKLSLENGWKFPMEYKQIYSNIIQNGYIHASELKKSLKPLFQYRHDGKFADAFIALCLNKSVDDVEIECVHPGVLTKSSVMTKVIIRVKGEAVLKFSYDAVALIKLEWWPEAAQEWLTRNRNWPSKRDVDELSSYCFIIPKPMTQHQTKSEIIDNSSARNEMDFRYTFSHIERKLMSMFSQQQMFVYFLFKSIFYKHVKSLRPDVIQSYYCKTVMLWTCEKFDPHNLFWGENWESTVQAVLYLFKELSAAFHHGILQHYFIKQINVIDNLPKRLRNVLTQKIETVISDIHKFIPQNVRDISKFGFLLNNAISTINQASNVIVKKKNIWWLILRRPLFIVNLIYCFTYHTHYLCYVHILIFIIGIVLALLFICLYETFNRIHF